MANEILEGMRIGGDIAARAIGLRQQREYAEREAALRQAAQNQAIQKQTPKAFKLSDLVQPVARFRAAMQMNDALQSGVPLDLAFRQYGRDLIPAGPQQQSVSSLGVSVSPAPAAGNAQVAADPISTSAQMLRQSFQSRLPQNALIVPQASLEDPQTASSSGLGFEKGHQIKQNGQTFQFDGQNWAHVPEEE